LVVRGGFGDNESKKRQGGCVSLVAAKAGLKGNQAKKGTISAGKWFMGGRKVTGNLATTERGD